jgi:hypothetical protein
MKKSFLYFILLFISSNLFAHDYKLKLIPAIAQGGGFFSYEQPLSNIYIKPWPYNPFRLTHLQLSLSTELTINNKLTLGVGIGNAIASYAYRIPVVLLHHTTNGTPVYQTAHFGWLANSGTTKFSSYFNYPIFASFFNKNNQPINQQGGKKIKTRGIQPSIHIGISLINIKPSAETYFYPYHDFDQAILLNGDTLTAYTIDEHINNWGSSIDGGLNFDYFSNGKNRLRFFIHYDQGLMPLYHMHIVVKENSRIADSNKMISRGSQLKFGIAFPINVYRSKVNAESLKKIQKN